MLANDDTYACAIPVVVDVCTPIQYIHLNPSPSQHIHLRVWTMGGGRHGHGHCCQVTSNEPGRIASPVKAQFLVEKLYRLKPFIWATVVACTCWNLSVVLTGCHKMLAC